MKNLSSLAVITLLSVAFSANVAAKSDSERPPKPDFSTIDADGDGVISFEEFSAKKPPHGDAQTIFDEIDSDGNGEITEQELSDHKPPRRERWKDTKMINSISGSASYMPQQSSQAAKLTTQQSDFVKETLSEFDPENLTSDDAQSIQAAFEEQGIAPTKELAELMGELEFDAKSIGDASRPEGQRPPPPPQNSLEQVNTDDVVSYLDELLEQYSSQLNDEDKDSILSAVQEKFGLSQGDSILSVKA